MIKTTTCRDSWKLLSVFRTAFLEFGRSIFPIYFIDGITRFPALVSNLLPHTGEDAENAADQTDFNHETLDIKPITPGVTNIETFHDQFQPLLVYRMPSFFPCRGNCV